MMSQSYMRESELAFDESFEVLTGQSEVECLRKRKEKLGVEVSDPLAKA